MDTSHPFVLVGYVLHERFLKSFFMDGFGQIDRVGCIAFQTDTMSEVIRAIGGQSDGRSVVAMCRGKRTLFTVSVHRVLVEQPISPALQKLTGQTHFSGFVVEAEAALHDTGETLFSLRLILDPQTKEVARKHNDLIFSVKDGDSKVLVVTPLANPEMISTHFGSEQSFLDQKVDISKLN